MICFQLLLHWSVVPDNLTSSTIAFSIDLHCSFGNINLHLFLIVMNSALCTLWDIRKPDQLSHSFDRAPLDVAKHPVGLESLTNYLIHKFILNSEEGVIKAGLWGIGGIGKTTVAKAMYNQVSSKFDAASFVFNVRTTAAEGRDLAKLQQKILKDLIKYDGKVDSVDEGISLFRDRLGRKRVLLILDDVDNREQSNALAGDWLAPGSRVILTSRDGHILHLVGVSSECIHEMSGLQINEALQLFCWHAFLKASPIPTHEDLSNRIVEVCKGHPLSLEVIGSFLYDKQNDEDCWREALHNITVHPDIHERLKISYNALSEDEKEIFLDIACFFIGEHKRCPVIFWESLYRMVHTAIHNLSLKLLIKIDEEGVFDMHDHLRDMGRTIAERERAGTRLWEAAHLSRGESSNNNFSRLRLIGGNPQRPETLYGSALRFLHMEYVPIDGITRAMLPPSLRWLRLRVCDKSFHLSLVRNIWRYAIQNLFHFSLEDRIWDLRIMQVHCDISNLQYLVSNILGNLSQLQHLELTSCTNLNNLPHSIGNLSNLHYLNLKGCKKLNKLPRTIGNLSELQHLELKSCTKLNNLPRSMDNLSKPQCLNLQGCKKLNKLPLTIGNLSQLKHLDLIYCEKLHNLSDVIGNLSQLKHLDLTFCNKLHNLPDTIGNLSKLSELNLFY
ncbi:hypothetical protein SUGI_0247380 [Cryptomeria japonica]|uniref:disease resistance protein RPV1-like n=1 Tax=Cryptomeria japonica TaxID=3369 RepID=UPI002408CCDC|nr:disease resistance protein RPV1-like [Cryptomeria japonica]GLJ15125.1 hypothetical protein SUGI_0247380 [Cryptomeria japonica]